MNRSRLQPDGRSLSDPDRIYPGWQLELPPDAVGVASPSSRPADRARRAAPAPQPAEPPPSTPITVDPGLPARRRQRRSPSRPVRTVHQRPLQLHPPTRRPGAVDGDDAPAAHPARAATATARARRRRPCVPTSGRQRRWSLALVAVLVTVGSALAFVVLWMNAGDRKPVLAMARDVAAGQVIESGDLTVVRVAVDQVIRPVSASSRDDVIGTPAAIDLRAGTILVQGHLGDDKGLETGTAVVAVPVPVDELPAPDLQPGDRAADLRHRRTGRATRPTRPSRSARAGSSRSTSEEHGPQHAAALAHGRREPRRRRGRGHPRRSDLPGARCELMGYIAFGSAKGSPGVTTTIAALAATWPEGRDLLVAEVDPAGGDLVVRFDLAPEPGFVTLAAAGRRELDRDTLLRHTQPLPSVNPPRAGARQVLVGPISADQALAALSAGARAACPRCWRRAGTTCSSIAGASTPARWSSGWRSRRACSCWWRARWWPRSTTSRRGCPVCAAANPTLLAVGEKPYTVAEMAETLGVPALGALPHDDRAAQALTVGHPEGLRVLRRSRLLRSAREVAFGLADWLGSQPHAPPKSSRAPDERAAQGAGAGPATRGGRRAVRSAPGRREPPAATACRPPTSASSAAS